MTARTVCGCSEREAVAGYRRRSADEVETEITAACRLVGALAGASRLTGQPIDRMQLAATLEGLRRLLVEPVEEDRHADP